MFNFIQIHSFKGVFHWLCGDWITFFTVFPKFIFILCYSFRWLDWVAWTSNILSQKATSNHAVIIQDWSTVNFNNLGFTWQIKTCTIHVRTIKSQWQKNPATNKAYLQCGRWSVVGGLTIVIWSMVGGLTIVIWSVVGCCSGRWSVFSQLLVGGWWFFRSVVGGSFGRWSVIFR